MQLASITFDGEKKNSKHYIIPSSYFQKKGITPIPVKVPKAKNNVETSAKANAVNATIAAEQAVKPKTPEKPHIKIDLSKGNTRRSGLSLSSIRAKKEHQIKQMEVVVDEENLPTEDFTEEAFLKEWHYCIDKIEKEGKHNLASILNMDTPKLKGTDIHLTFPTETNKKEVIQGQYDLMTHIRTKLKNFDISLVITVNEVMDKKYVFTPQDKYDKLKEANPNLEILRRTFDLDI